MPKVGQRSALRSRLLRVFAGFDACDLPESAPAIGSQTFMRLPWAESEREKVRQADVLSLAGRGEDSIPPDSPVLARIAEQAGISVAEWFARLPASKVS